ncbi:hypothetical protein GCM10007415_10600 [Parapedobacter pyrenivorans]|uniref:Acyltransferase n=1 Tax=Parapedobacter pyrenivorans TaxID=1305674 RepID=A0A917M7K3_9SPHI|nr:acyltransferase [Parapedobacter pyrenivorans]GGG80108.1 hypothetical protein GCM10007415_10600 [Parapedobacter pyrenivorans]
MIQSDLRNKYEIHPTFKFNGRFISFYGAGRLIIDENSYIGGLSTIQIHEDCKVFIGKGCSISHNVRIYTSSKSADGDFSDKESVPIKKGNVVIEDFAWIGANVFISPGVTIGKNSVVGANSMVTKDVAENSIYGGVPAKLIRMKKLNA